MAFPQSFLDELVARSDIVDVVGSYVALTKKGLLVACQDGNTVLVRELQAKGGKRMPAPDYFRGHPITIE